ncbi:MAG TPA: chemotaxis protein CheA [Terracidiphilus sp.]|nr:chemotaxis protein CheA [Terracidiphilus sp.]
MRQTISIDSEQFKQTFREEAREILVDLESALLELSEFGENGELVGKVFRALHTIKGSGAMFGFERLAAFTHDLETAFDLVRAGRLQVNAELIDLTLAAVDQIRGMLEGDATAESPVREEILDKVRKWAGIAVVQEPEEKAEVAKTGKAAEPGLGSEPLREWRIHFVPGPEFLKNGANPLLLLQELKHLGRMSVRACTAGIPSLKEIDPERCYVAWDAVLNTAVSRDAIRDVFIFVEGSCELVIDPAVAEGDALSEAPPDSEKVGETCAGLGAAKEANTDRRTGPADRRVHDHGEMATSLRVPVGKLDQLVNLVGELVTVQARLSELAAQRDDAEVVEVSEEVERLTAALRENSMNIRMIPIRGTFEKFRRLVHDLARDLGKDVELTLEGTETELDKTVIEQLGDPLMHLIRNSMDHGIETREVRASSGKQSPARIHLSARHAGASVLIGISDDGAGIDADAVRERAVDRGLIGRDARLSDAEVNALIFQPGFSTAKQVTDVSGRGVGMDVVRQRVESLRGTVEVSSKAGAGTSVMLRLPLTLAIIDGLLVSVGDARFVLPLANTLECIELTREDIARANGKQVVNLRGKLIPYISLRQHFKISGEPPQIEQIMVVETENGRFGLAVDQVLGNCQSVIKSLGRFYRNVQAVSGATILGNGSVALILDSERMFKEVERATLRGPRGHPVGPAKNLRGNPIPQ